MGLADDESSLKATRVLTSKAITYFFTIDDNIDLN